MASGSWAQHLIKCPFYKHDDGHNNIVCEGLVPHSSVNLSYQHIRDFKTQLLIFCSNHYKKCEVYRMLNQKYEE